MKISVKLTRNMLDGIRQDLERPHPFAFERVGFITTGATYLPGGNVLLLGRQYQPVADDDYVRSDEVGAMIGPQAMRRAMEWAYKHRSGLLHVHTHGGTGRPMFSVTDRRSAFEFVTGFFNALPRIPQGILVLSNDSAAGLIWTGKNAQPVNVHQFTQVGVPLRPIGGSYDLS